MSPPVDATANAHSIEEISPYLHRHIAPDGSILVDCEAVEWGNTHWVESPKVTEAATGIVLLDLWGTDWDAAVSFPGQRKVRLSFRRYHVGGGLDAEINLEGMRYGISERSGATSEGPLADMPAALEAASHRAAAAIRAADLAQPQPSAPRARRGRLIATMLILVGAIVTIGIATFIVQNLTPEPVQHLDTVPPMPK